jgi:hypothetical protein
MKKQEFLEEAFDSFRRSLAQEFSFKAAGQGKPCGAAHISASYVCRLDGGEAKEIKGSSPLKNTIDDSLNDKFAPTEHDLKMMKEGFDRAAENDNRWIMPFQIPQAYDDKSGTPEAVEEICSIRGSLKQGKDGKIEIPDNVKVSAKARELVSEYNELDLGKFYTSGPTGTELNVNGLGVMAGPRDSVPKDSVRGFVQYVALRRQDASLIDGPNGKVIDSYRDPFTGTPRRFYGDKVPKSGKMKGQTVTAILGSQDHWERPFGVYGIKSENDVRNTVFMPAGMNSAKGEMSPSRFAYTVLAKRGVISDRAGLKQDATALGGFGARYAKAGERYDFLPRNAGRSVEQRELGETASRFIAKANQDVTVKYVPRMVKDLNNGKVTTTADAARHVYSVAKQESERNYFGGYRRFTEDRVIRPGKEANMVFGVDLNQSSGQVQKAIEARIIDMGLTPQEAVQVLVDNHS